MINRPQLVKNQETFNSGAKDPYTNNISISKSDTNKAKLTAQLKDINGIVTSNKDKDRNRQPIEAANSLLNDKLNTTRTKSLSKSTQGRKNTDNNTRHIMILNNRLAKQDEKLSILERNLIQLNTQSIGYRELGLTLILSILIFTSLGLVFANHSFTYKSLPIDNLNQLFTKLDKKINSLQTTTQTNNNIYQGDVAPPFQSKQYHWPLEKSPKPNQIGYNNFKNGINIPAKLGDPIVAIDNGIIIFSEQNFADYGNLILVQHSDNVISVYGNNYSNYVKKGQTVKKGQLLAAVGETKGNLPRLYFEIRHKGKAQDPFLYY